MPPHLLASFGSIPDNNHPSGRVVRRHLARFVDEGWQVTLAADTDNATPASTPPGCRLVPIPRRRCWYPPARPAIPLSINLHNYLQARDARHAFPDRRPDVVLAGSGHPHLGMACSFARNTRIPLHVIMHDWWPEFSDSRPAKAFAERLLGRVLPRASVVWTASNELSVTTNLHGATDARTLAPIPDGLDAPDLAMPVSRILHLVAPGSYAPSLAPVYAALADRLHCNGGCLTIVTNCPEVAARDLSSYRNISIRPYFNQPKDLLAYARAEATAFVVAQPQPPAAHPWTLTSFPSKLVEVVHARLPVVIIAAPSTSVGLWAAGHQWKSYAEESSPPALDKVLTQLSSVDSWRQAAQQAGSVADGEFDPDFIHAQLREGILASTRTLSPCTH